MTYKTWNHYLLFLIMLTIFLLVSVNYIVDPFSIFNSGFLKEDYQLNERFRKIEFLNKNHQKYNAYMFGSSRLASTDPALLEKYLPNTRFYNLTLAGCSQYDNLLLLKYFIKKQFEVKVIYLQIDLTDVNGFNTRQINPFARHHPDVENMSLLKFYTDFLTILPLQNIIGKIKLNLSTEVPLKKIRYDIQGSGRWYYDEANKLIAQNPLHYLEKEISLKNHMPIQRNIPGRYLKENIEALKQLKRLADQHNIEIIAFIPPYHHFMMDSLNIASTQQYLYEISQILNFWNFSGYHPFSFDNRYFYSRAYFQASLVEHMLAKIFDNQKNDKLDVFGVYVTKQNSNEMVRAITNNMQYDEKQFS